MNTGEIILYQSNDNSVQIDVRIENETVWLTQAQMVLLFEATKQNISLHINNIFREGELLKDSVVKYSLTTAKDGKKWFAFSRIHMDPGQILTKLASVLKKPPFTTVR